MTTKVEAASDLAAAASLRVLFAGDTHGNTKFVRYLIARAVEAGADRIVQVGDFGFWSHAAAGVAFLDDCEHALKEAGVTLIFVDGNHDNIALLRRQHTDRDAAGFNVVRPHLRYAARGHRWTWAGVRFLALGGAYSVDKDQRLKAQAVKHRKAVIQERHRRAAGRPPKGVPDFTETLWFPDEELTESEIATVLDDSTPIDVLITHDKPRASHVDYNRKNLPECWANQDRVQNVAVTLQPTLLVHGHLHRRYTDWVRVSGDAFMRVEGLGADPQTRGDVSDYRPEKAWLVMDLPAELMSHRR